MTSASPRRATVIGSGIIGLTSAICLTDAGFQVTIVTASMPGDTTSAAAGAIWGPYETGGGHRPTLWARQTLSELIGLAALPGTGVYLVPGIQASESETPRPSWSSDVESFETCPAEQLPPSYRTGWHFSVPIIDMPRHLAYLVDRFRSGGGRIEMRDVEGLRSERRDGLLLVNCTGIGARELVGDALVSPARGQVVVVENPGIDEFFVAKRGDDPEQLYVLPHGDTVSLGGTFEFGNWNATPDPEVARGIIERCTAVCPGLRDAPVVGHRVGLRPCRPAVRLEISGEPGAGLVIHNYGHGGSGVSMAWGCARETVDLALRAIGTRGVP
ncbi:FAD-dependent oxidoreductase [Nocardia amamiensis]|uniref:FAD-dependent oxidoreductase n=1 Tax=Nocardia TaxID=1817 RepID=UPI0033FF7A05